MNDPMSRLDGDTLFQRELYKPEPFIRSTCKRCGLVIEGSVSDTHAQNEREHAATCSGGARMFLVRSIR